MSLSIKFTDITESVHEDFYPKPAAKDLPKWFKNLDTYYFEKLANLEGMSGHRGIDTAKRCLPMFDAISAGYLIYTDSDIYVSHDPNGNKFYEWNNPESETIEFHPKIQLGNLNIPENYHAVPKWINPWSIQTPKGCSSLIIPPINREDNPIKIFSGVVDTDKFHSRVNFPFLFNDEKFTGLIPAGTPIAQIVPFKRNDFVMKIGGAKELEKAKKVKTRLSVSLFNAYRKLYHVKKRYR